MTQIEDYQVYNDRMRRSMWDKAFFMDKVPGAELILDYGCADGSLVRFLQGLFPAMRFIGFDIDPAMISAAEAQDADGSWFFSDMEAVIGKIRELGVDGSRVAMNFSSVFHEVFHYGFDTTLVSRLIGAVAPRYVVVRDMLYRSPDDAAAASPAAVERVRAHLPESQVRDFEERFGSIGLRRNLVHLLLKYRYTENWERECAENYFSYTPEKLRAVVDPGGDYEPIFRANYILPWLRCDAEKTFGLSLGREVTTHIALILARKSGEKRVSIDETEGRRP